MAMGMTYDQFWNGDPTMARYFRKAHELRQEQENQRLWLQGLYFYEALCDVSPTLRAFKPQKPLEYRHEPIPLSGRPERSDTREISKEEQSDNKAKVFMEMFATRFNQEYEKKGG